MEEAKDFNKYTSKVNFAPITDFVLQNGQLTQYQKGDFFCRQNESCKLMGYVAEGSFRYCCTNSRGENKIVGYTFEHSFVGNYPAFRLGDNSNVDIQAICNCTLYIVNNRQLEEFYDRDDTNLKLARHIAEILLWEVYERMISMYSMTPEERYREILERCPGLLNLISLKELASYLMICPETLSRLRRKLVQK